MHRGEDHRYARAVADHQRFATSKTPKDSRYGAVRKGVQRAIERRSDEGAEQ